MELFFKEMVSPVGKLKLIANENSLVAILWDQDRPNRVLLKSMTQIQNHSILQTAEQQLVEYFQRQRRSFELPLAFVMGTAFQQEVWNALKNIPYGDTWSYADLAGLIGRPKAVRAVGAAVGRNPLSIVVACHRVIGSNGSLTGFAGGLQNKKTLLELESRLNQNHMNDKVADKMR